RARDDRRHRGPPRAQSDPGANDACHARPRTRPVTSGTRARAGVARQRARITFLNSPPLTSAAHDYLFSLEYLGIKLGLEQIRALIERLGHPDLAYRSIV